MGKSTDQKVLLMCISVQAKEANSKIVGNVYTSLV